MRERKVGQEFIVVRKKRYSDFKGIGKCARFWKLAESQVALMPSDINEE